MTKKLLFITCLVLIVLCGPAASLAAENQIKWYSYDEGLALGKKNGKKIFVHFYADWCHWCKEMKKNTFSKPDIITYMNDHFISILVDTEKERKVAGTYFVRGLPASVFLTKEGEKVFFDWTPKTKVSLVARYFPPDVFLKLITYIHTEKYSDLSLQEYVEKK